MDPVMNIKVWDFRAPYFSIIGLPSVRYIEKVNTARRSSISPYITFVSRSVFTKFSEKIINIPMTVRRIEINLEY